MLFDKGTAHHTFTATSTYLAFVPFLSIRKVFTMKILCVGDVVSRVGRDMLFKYVDELKYQKDIDFVIVNGENSSHGRGMTRSTYSEMKRAGADVFTMGNHVWGAKEVVPIMEQEGDVIRPLNMQGTQPGNGSVVMTAKNGTKIGIINLIGQVNMLPCNSPFDAVEKEVEKIREITPVIFVDFHAEVTSEKMAMGYFLDGKVSAVFGTHTHIQTADAKILKGGTGYITDLGMTGPEESVLGMNKNIIIDRFVSGVPQKFEIASGKGQFCGCIFTVDENSGKCTDIERLYIEE